MKLKVGADTILYPDVFVACDAADLRADQVFTAPTMAVAARPAAGDGAVEVEAAEPFEAVVAESSGAVGQHVAVKVARNVVAEAMPASAPDDPGAP